MISAARIALIAGLVLPAVTDASVINTLAQVTAQYGLNEHHIFDFPSKSLSSSEATTFLTSEWDVNSQHIQFGMQDIAFVDDPATSKSKKRQDASSSVSSTKSHKQQASSSTVSAPSAGATAGAASSNSSQALRIEYPEGSWSAGTGGTQFTAQPLNASSHSTTPFGSSVPSDGKFERMLLAYDIFFPAGFQFNQGGKLPGLRGGPDPTGCSGGHQSDGNKCFSTRLMWRTGQLGEIYAYLPMKGSGLCNRQDITCNKDYGTSIGRSTFSFVTGTWQTVWLYVELNQVGYKNGMVSLWYNGVRAIKVDQLEFRKTDDIKSIAGLYFSTFFGGYDDTWATPLTQYSYFRNIQLYAGLGASNATGPKSGALSAIQSPNIAVVAIGAIGVLAAAAGLV